MEVPAAGAQPPFLPVADRPNVSRKLSIYEQGPADTIAVYTRIYVHIIYLRVAVCVCVFVLIVCVDPDIRNLDDPVLIPYSDPASDFCTGRFLATALPSSGLLSLAQA